MEATLFAPVPSLPAAPAISSDTRGLLLLLPKPPSSHPSSIPIPSYLNLSAKQPKSRTQPLFHFSYSASRLRRPTTRRTHHRAATGYAAALVDVALCDGALDAAERDAGRFVRAVRAAMAADPAAAAEEVVRRVAEGGGFYRRLVALVRMLVGKGKAWMVGEVMAEFLGICDELGGTMQVAVVTKAKVMHLVAA